MNSTANIHIYGSLDMNDTAKLESSINWCFKLNVDATTNWDKQISALQGFIRDARGNVITVTIRSSKFYRDVVYVKAKAMALGLQAVGNAELSPLIVAIDS